MYILIDKEEKRVYAGRDRRAISKKSGVSENTLKWYSKKGEYYETAKHIHCVVDITIGKKGGERKKNTNTFGDERQVIVPDIY